MPPVYPTLPTIGDISPGTSTGSTIACTTAAEFSTALTNAMGGDIITLEAGTNFVGPFTLPNKAGSSCITIRTSADDSALPAAGVRIDPSYASVLPKILSPGTNSRAIKCANGAHHYRFLGVEISTNAEGAAESALVMLGEPTITDPEDTPHHIEFDRCYAHAYSVTSVLRRAFYLNSASTTIKNCYVSEIKEVGADTQAILILNGPGPFLIDNNYLEASGENLLTGGADPAIDDLIPSDIQITRNFFTKKLTWKLDDPSYAGTEWTVKNLLETKMGQRILIEGNIFQYCWVQSQTGFAILLNVRNQDGNAPWAITQDVTFRYNWIRHATKAYESLGTDDNNPSLYEHRFYIHNNLWEDIGWPGIDDGRGVAALLANPGIDMIFDHNTFINPGNSAILIPSGVPPSDQGTGFVWTNNIHYHNDYGVKADGTAIGTASLNVGFADWVYTHNVMIANPVPGNYPANNFDAADLAAVGFTNTATGDYSLLASSPYHNAGSDGADIGVDWPALQAALAGEEEETPSSGGGTFYCVSSI